MAEHPAQDDATRPPTPGPIQDLDRTLRSRRRRPSASEVLAAEPPGPRS